MANQHTGKLEFRAFVASYGQYETPHYVRQAGDARRPTAVNQDYGFFQPDVGLLVANGEGEAEAGALASRTVVGAVVRRSLALRINSLPPEEASKALLSDVLPYADQQLDEAKQKRKLPSASAALGALVFCARNHLVAVGVGDVMAYGYREHETPAGKGSTFSEINPRQAAGEDLLNKFDGSGRSGDDFVKPFSAFPDDRFLAVTRGLTGTMPFQTIPEFRSRSLLDHNIADGDDPWEIAERIARIPDKLSLLKYSYQPPNYDLTVGVMLAQAKNGRESND